MRFFSTLVAIVIATPYAAATDILISANGGSCNGSMKLQEWSISCNGDQYCSPADKANAMIQARFKSDLSSDEVCADLSASITLMNLNVYTKSIATNKNVNACDYASSDYCPAAGVYDFEVDGLKIPNFDSASWMNLLGGRASLTLYQSDCSTVISQCTFDVKTSVSSGSGSAMVVGTSFAVVSLLGVLFVSRKRRTVRTESEENGHGFELMSDRGQQQQEESV
mmetsp:Transcript_10877/g.16042  ORF Transcript_10877/g.16042 Transcript_10877/m.16042 type:complete len:224 (-) Transcript_10877:217-888(-)